MVDANRSFWKSALGVDTSGGREARVGDSISQIIIATGIPLVVEDVRRDDRVRATESRLSTEPAIPALR
ncbi:MAG TPA: hypothetical protein VNP92_25940, partial [Actinophytocola sp.]|nr:hypothetical protein [Actinophytocola sp.]